jgi:hypothetical protein
LKFEHVTDSLCLMGPDLFREVMILLASNELLKQILHTLLIPW